MSTALECRQRERTDLTLLAVFLKAFRRKSEQCGDSERSRQKSYQQSYTLATEGCRLLPDWEDDYFRCPYGLFLLLFGYW